jgi:signal transduction histidine kinase
VTPSDDPARPIVAFAQIRVLVVTAAFVAALVIDLPHQGRLIALLGALFVPWSLGVLALAVRAPALARSPLIPAGDLALLAAVEAAVPETYGAVRFVALFLVAAWAHYQSAVVGLALAAAAIAALVTVAVATEPPVEDEVLAFYEVLFGLSVVAVAVAVGRLAKVELAETLQARRLTRRMISSENEMRRRVADAIHDGPVQELVSLEMMLSAAEQASDRGDTARASQLLSDARAVAERNVETLRDEIVGLGPYAFDQLTFGAAVEGCIDTWRRRYRLEVLLTIEPLELPSEVAGDLFRITQEAVTNAGRHAEAQNVAISLRRVDGRGELRIADDGKGFGDVDPLSPTEPRHIGLAGIRERAELLGSELTIETGERGTKLVVTFPLPGAVG